MKGDEHSFLLLPSVTTQLLQSVLRSVSSLQTKKAYRTAILDFLTWFQQSAKPSLGSSLKAWRTALVQRGLAPASVNQRLTAVRLLFRQARKQGLIQAEDVLDIQAVGYVQQLASSEGLGLTGEQAKQLLAVPDPQTLLGKRDIAMLALLVACGLKRGEIVGLRVDHFGQQQSQPVLLLSAHDRGAANRTVPVLRWVQKCVNRWLHAAGIRGGLLFRRVRKNGQLDPVVTPLSDDSVYDLVKQTGAAIGKPQLTPRDLRRTYSQLSRQARDSLDPMGPRLGQGSDDSIKRSSAKKAQGS